MIKTSETAPESAVEAAQRQRAEAQQAADDARRIRAEIERQLADSQARLAAAEQQAKEAEQRIEEAENASRLAERDAMAGGHISHEGAQLIARDLLELFARARTESRSENRRPFWEAVDDVRVRLLTNDVEETARPLVLAIELLIGCGLDRWEQSKFRQISGEHEPSGARGDMPVDDPRVERLEQELRRELEGRPTRDLEPIGQMIASDVTPAQIARAYGLVDAAGEPEPEIVGQMVNEAFRRAGVTSTPSEAIRRMGCLSLEQAWREREKRISTRTTDRLVPGTDALPGQGRPGRGYGGTGDLPDAPADAENDDAPPQRQPIRMPRFEGSPDDIAG